MCASLVTPQFSDYYLRLTPIIFVCTVFSRSFYGIPNTFGCGRCCCYRFAWLLLLLFGINYLISQWLRFDCVFLNAPYTNTRTLPHTIKTFLPFIHNKTQHYCLPLCVSVRMNIWIFIEFVLRLCVRIVCRLVSVYFISIKYILFHTM